MTTPRVTVPVEQLENWRNDLSLHGVGDIQTAVEIDTMLSAAPAPEGGAVDPLAGWTPHDGVWGEPPALAPETLVHVLRRNGNVAGPYRSGRIEWHHQNADSDPLFYRPAAALATREEAPAFDLIEATVSKADGSNPRKVYVDRVEGRIYEIAPAEAVTADSLRSVPDEEMRALLSCKDVGSGRAHLASIINALRAQPPAREDAQPVAWYRGDPASDDLEIGFESDGLLFDKSVWRPLYTHSAPDALRAAVEPTQAMIDAAVKYCADATGHFPGWARTWMKGYLRAALQAEQKGGA